MTDEIDDKQQRIGFMAIQILVSENRTSNDSI